MVKDIKLETATFENTVLLIALDNNDSCLLSKVIKFYKSVFTNKGLCDTSTDAKKLINEFLIKASMRKDIY
jgi:metallopeptidase MepB